MYKAHTSFVFVRFHKLLKKTGNVVLLSHLAAVLYEKPSILKAMLVKLIKSNVFIFTLIQNYVQIFLY